MLEIETSKVCPQCGGKFSSDAAFCPEDGEKLLPSDDEGAVGADATVESDSRSPYAPMEADEAVTYEDNTLLGATLDGRFSVDRLLGEGSMGRVYVGTQLSVDRDVAIKSLRKVLSDNETIRKRFAREAEIISQLVHPNIVRLIESGEADGGILYLIMEYVEGFALSELIERGPMQPGMAIDLAAQIAGALGEAHALGVVHRDLKPDNLIVTRAADGAFRLKILDFGLAYLAGEAERITTDGKVHGTPAYMAPEQARGKEVGAASDLYTLGILLFQMITGERPFYAETALELMRKHVKETPPPLSDFVDRVPAGLAELIDELLEKDPEKRPSDAVAIAARLEKLRNAPMVASGSSSAEEVESPDASTSANVKASGESRKTGKLVGIFFLFLAVLVIAVTVAYLLGRSSVDGESRPDATPTESASP